MHAGFRRSVLFAVLGLVAGTPPRPVAAGDLVLEVRGGGRAVTRVGAVRRWDGDGNPRVPVDPKAKIDAPRWDAEARPGPGGRWLFAGLPGGRYDLVILASGRVRVEGFHYPPVVEFEAFLAPDAPAPDADDRAAILQDVARSRHYENKVVPLFLAGDANQSRILVQLVRDQPTSYDAEAGFPVATVRHEVWRYTNRFGKWSKERPTRVLDRVLLARDEFRRWTWVWEPALGGIEVGSGTTGRSYSFPARFDPGTSTGWFPD